MYRNKSHGSPDEFGKVGERWESSAVPTWRVISGEEALRSYGIEAEVEDESENYWATLEPWFPVLGSFVPTGSYDLLGRKFNRQQCQQSGSFVEKVTIQVHYDLAKILWNCHSRA